MFTILKKESIIKKDEKRKSIRRRQTSECFHLIFLYTKIITEIVSKINSIKLK